MKRLKKELTLDYKTWRCGGCVCSHMPSDTQLGKGYTELLNVDGYMCCLGQFALQSGLKRADILTREDMNSCEVKILELVNKFGDNSKLSRKCIEINDDETTSISQKVKKLRKVLGKYHFKLKLKNFPKDILRDINAKSSRSKQDNECLSEVAS